jgi:UDP-glucose:(heptosyl)LPS alpha-1,3-glucosyltransferase
MKIALVREKVGRFGGAEKNVWFLAKGLVDKGHDIHVFAAAWEDEIPGATYHRVAYFKGITFLKPLFFALKCKRLIGRETFDVIHSFERTLRQDIYRAGDGCHLEWMRRLAKERGFIGGGLIWLNPKNMVQLCLERALLRDPRLKKVITNSEMVKNEIIRNYRLPPGMIAVIYNGVEPVRGPVCAGAKRELRQKYGFRQDEYLVLFVGSNYERKGLRFLIDGIRPIRDAKVVVVGKGDEKKYKRLAEGRGVGERIFFYGPQRKLADFYRMSDVFVLPTLYDPFSNVTLEAMSYGLPVITTPDNGAAEVVGDEDGFVVAAHELTAPLASLKEGKTREVFAQHAVFAAERYTVGRVVDATGDVYRDVCLPCCTYHPPEERS